MNNNEVEDLFDDSNKVKTPINQYTDISKTTDIKVPKKVVDKPSVTNNNHNTSENGHVLNKASSYSRNNYSNNNPVRDVKLFEHKPHYEFKFNIKAFAYMVIAIAIYLIIIPKFFGKFYDKYMANNFIEQLATAKQNKTEILVPLLGLFVPVLTVLSFYITLIGFYIYNFLYHNEKMEIIKNFMYKSFLYTALLSIVLVALYRYTKIDLIMPVIKVLTLNGYKMAGFIGI